MEFIFRVRRGRAGRGDMPAIDAHDTRQLRPADEPGDDSRTSPATDGDAGRLPAAVAAFAVTAACVLGLVNAGASPETALTVTVACAVVAQRFGQHPDGPDGPGGLLQLA